MYKEYGQYCGEIVQGVPMGKKKGAVDDTLKADLAKEASALGFSFGGLDHEFSDFAPQPQQKVCRDTWWATPGLGRRRQEAEERPAQFDSPRFRR